MVKRFFFISAGILCIALVYSLNAQRAEGQGSGTLVGLAIGNSGQGEMLFGVDSQGGIYAGQAVSPTAGHSFRSVGCRWEPLPPA